MTLTRLWAFLAIALPVLAAMLASLSSVDLTYQLRAGGEILDARAIPTVDSWTFTAFELPWLDQQWGAQVILETVYRLGGWSGLVLLRAALVGLIFGTLVVIGRRRGLDARTAAILSLAAFFVAAPALALRPQLFGMACFAIVLLLVTDRRAHPRLLWFVPLVVLVWANLHGSFFLGPVVLGLAWLEDLHDREPAPHRAPVVSLVSVVAACLTPFGPSVWLYAVGLSTNSEVSARVSEWQSTSLHTLPGILFFASALAVVALIARRGRATPWPTLAWLMVFFVVGIYAQRGLAWWPLAVVPAVAGTLIPSGSASDRTGPPLIRRLNVVVAGVLVLAAIALLPVWRPIDPGTGVPTGVLTQAPPGVTATLRDVAHPGDRVFNPQSWGSWFEYALPDQPVAVDSRIELFSADTWRRYGDVLAGVEGWQAQLDAWDVTFVVLAAPGASSVARFEHAGWHVLHADSDGVVLGRR